MGEREQRAGLADGEERARPPEKVTAREVLERELYWASTGDDDRRPLRTAEEVRAILRRIDRDLHRSAARGEIWAEWEADRGPRPKRFLKRVLHKLLRPVGRRYDRVTADLASLTAALAERLEKAEQDVRRLEAGLAEALAGREPRPEPVPLAEQDSYYWRYESRMRGSQESVVAKLRQYESVAHELRAAAPADEAPLWLDVGCGRGELGALLIEWGWRVHGVDTSRQAVEESGERGVSASQADVFDYLRDHTGESPMAISAIQLIEHLPKDSWLALFRATRRVLADGGAFIVETINPLAVEALTGAFFADVTHTWPAHPETLRLMALHAGYARADVMYLNDDERGSARDFALIARV